MRSSRARFLLTAGVARAKLVRSGYVHGVSLGFLERSGLALFNSPAVLLEGILPEKSASEIDAAVAQAESVVRDADLDEGAAVGPAPSRWNVEHQTAMLLAAIVLLERPRALVEVGVANGTSTRALLAAMQVINQGQLVSFDIDARCKAVVSPALASRWEFRILPASKHASFSRLKDEVGALHDVDLWFSDADHSLAWQQAEWRLALKSVRPGGLLVADDIDATPAWPTVTKGWHTAALVDTRKVTGVVRVGVHQ